MRRLAVGPVGAYRGNTDAALAQRIRASDFGSEGRGFESLGPRSLFRKCRTHFLPFWGGSSGVALALRTVAEWPGHRDHGALLLKTYSYVRAEHEREMVARVRFGMPTSPSGTTSEGT